MATTTLILGLALNGPAFLAAPSTAATQTTPVSAASASRSETEQQGRSWSAEALETRVLAELAADGIELPPRALRIRETATARWRLELRSDDGERRWRELASLPEELEAAAASARIVILELLQALPRRPQ